MFPPGSDQELEDFAARFRDATLPKSEWTHLAHLVVGLWHVRRFGPAEALERLRVGIRQLNDAHGTPNTDSSGYHETVTRAYVVLLAEFLDGGTATSSLAEPCRRLLESPLAAREALLSYYSRERLFTPQARASWVEPDKRPLPVPREAGAHGLITAGKALRRFL